MITVKFLISNKFTKTPKIAILRLILGSYTPFESKLTKSYYFICIILLTSLVTE